MKIFHYIKDTKVLEENERQAFMATLNQTSHERLEPQPAGCGTAEAEETQKKGKTKTEKARAKKD